MLDSFYVGEQDVYASALMMDDPSPADLEPASHGSVASLRSPLLLLGRNSVSCLLPSLTIQVPRPACSGKRIVYTVAIIT